MRNLETRFMGLNLKNPIIIGSSELSSTIVGVEKLTKYNPGAIVLKSLFEEQIMINTETNFDKSCYDHTEAFDYITKCIKNNVLENYLNLIKESKVITDIPIIASVNCISDMNWINFTKEIERAGADAIELNVSILPSNLELKSTDYEKKIFSIVENVSKCIKIPISLKLSSYSSNLGNMISQLYFSKYVDSFVLFNRLYQPDIDIESESVSHSNVFSADTEYTNSLRWMAILSDNVKSDLIASTGIHNGRTAIKLLLAGATAVQVVSAIYKKGPKQIQVILNDIEKWMDQKGYNSINEFRGKLSYEKVKNPEIYERIQFMKYINFKTFV